MTRFRTPAAYVSSFAGHDPAFRKSDALQTDTETSWSESMVPVNNVESVYVTPATSSPDPTNVSDEAQEPLQAVTWTFSSVGFDVGAPVGAAVTFVGAAVGACAETVNASEYLRRR